MKRNMYLILVIMLTIPYHSTFAQQLDGRSYTPGKDPDIEIDGGINPDNAPLARAAGADVIVAGTAIFGDPDPVAAVGRLRAAADGVE